MNKMFNNQIVIAAIRIAEQGDLAEALPVRGAEIGRRLLVRAIEASQHGEHDQQPERQRPRELGPERRRVPTGLHVEQLEREADAEPHQDLQEPLHARVIP